MKKEKTSKKNQKELFDEVMSTVHDTIASKGWYWEIKSVDDNYKYATTYVSRQVGGIVTEGSFDITVDNGVKVSLNVLTPFNQHGRKLGDVVENLIPEK